MPSIESVGYEGRTIEEFVADLTTRSIYLLVDVRLNAVSRRPGFSKTALRTALAAAGIDYLHLRALGNPKSNRAAFGGDDLETGRKTYRDLLAAPDAAEALQDLAHRSAEQHVAVMCFERDEQRCHRQVVLDEIVSLRVS